LSVTALAASANAQLPIAPEGGLNIANLSGRADGYVQNTTPKAGLGLGAVIDVRLSNKITFQPGLFYEMTGFKQSDQTYGDVTVKVNTLTVPLNFQYSFRPHNRGFFIGVGPYIGVNVSGKIKIAGSSMDLKFGSEKPNPLTGSDGDYMKTVDVGLGVNAGYRWDNGLFVRLHSQTGLTNLDPISDADNTMYTSAVGITVGYFLNSSKGHKGYNGHGGVRKKY
jgi:hypothetical protein